MVFASYTGYDHHAVQALRQMGGSLRVTYDGWREELKRCLAHTEAVIDFADVRDCPHPCGNNSNRFKGPSSASCPDTC